MVGIEFFDHILTRLDEKIVLSVSSSVEICIGVSN